MDVNLYKLELAAEMLKAIAHPLRLSIVDLLDAEKSLTVTEIYKTLEIEQAIASHHLGVLKNKGVLVSKREGKNCYYKLKHSRLSDIISCINKCQDDF